MSNACTVLPLQANGNLIDASSSPGNQVCQTFDRRIVLLSPAGQTVVPTQANSSQVHNCDGVGYRFATHLAWVGSSSIEFDQAQIFAQPEPSFPPFGHLNLLKPTLAKLFCYCYFTTDSDDWMVSCELTRLGGTVWPPADTSCDFVTGSSWEYCLARALVAPVRIYGRPTRRFWLVSFCYILSYSRDFVLWIHVQLFLFTPKLPTFNRMRGRVQRALVRESRSPTSIRKSIRAVTQHPPLFTRYLPLLQYHFAT